MSFSPSSNLEYYEKLYRDFSYSPRSLGWNRNNQRLRFESLLRQLPPMREEHTIADFGCGFGDLFYFLLHEKKAFNRYVGFELCNSLFNEATSRLAHENRAEIKNIDFLKQSEVFDFVVGSGVFGLGNGIEDDMYDFIGTVFEHAASYSRKGFSFNFLSNACDRRSNPHSFNAEAAMVNGIVSKFSRRYIIDHSYCPFEFTITVWLQEQYDDNLWYL